MSAEALSTGAGMAAASDEATLAAAARARVQKRKREVILGQVTVLFVIVAGWQVAALTGVIDPFFFGSPWGIVVRLYDWMLNGTAYGSFWLQIWVTLEESILGFIVGVVSGIICGVALGEIPYLADVFGPYIKIVNALPRIVLGSIFVMWLGLGLPSKVLLAAVLVFFVVFFNAFQGVRSVDRNLISNARILGASRLQVVRHVVFPSAMTWIIASLHVALGFSIIGAIVGEFLGSEKGLGLVIATAQNTFDANGVFGAMLVIGLLALSAEWVMAKLEKRLLAWQPKGNGDSTIQGL
ncbi:ABC transporter permease [Solirhodobacter olei]|uniref:ABC transporter permease n=1 Tax=Solirhodobacter olei TaxID=2493082 RepID=UPI000FDC12E6|nr:ABC transporter permease [Solirhodobacter olei]